METTVTTREEVLYSDVHLSMIPKKYAIPGGILLLGYFAGGAIVKGAYIAGGLTVLSYGFLVYKAREYHPAFYNWMLDYHFAMDAIISIAAVMTCGTKLSGLVMVGVIGISAGLMFEAIRQYVGKVEGVESLKLGKVVEDAMIAIAATCKTVAMSVILPFKGNKEAAHA
jgi:hypothetical protein